MSIEKIYDYLPSTKEGRTIVGLGMVLFGLFASAAIFTIVLIPLGVVVLAYDYEWARNLLRKVRDGLTSMRKSSDTREKPASKSKG
ncbi:MAG: PGPGW domain-containing protein [Alphaproteobacteria bacterium]